MTEITPATIGQAPTTSQAGGRAAAGSGHWLVLGILLVAAGLGAFAVWFQWGQTRRCLAFFGPATVGRIQTAPRVELWTLVAKGYGVRATDRLDVSQAPGLVHLRRGLIEDVNYTWGDPAPGAAVGQAGSSERLPAESWDLALAFLDQPPGGSDGEQAAAAGLASLASATVLVFDLDGAGAAAVVGQPGRIGLGRLTMALRTWANDAKSRPGGEGKTGL